MNRWFNRYQKKKLELVLNRQLEQSLVHLIRSNECHLNHGRVNQWPLGFSEDSH